jgi:hypothetical protein
VARVSTRSRALAAAAAAAALLAAPPPVSAEPVVVLDGDRARLRDDPYVPRADLPAPPARPGGAPPGKARKQRGPSVYAELRRLLTEGAIDQAQHDARRASYRRARRAMRRLAGTRRAELLGAIRNVEGVARSGALTASRLRPLFLILDRNREWWTTGSLVRNGARVAFDGSELVFQYYRGEGIQLQPLANFGKANALWSDERDERLRALLEELAALAADRAGGTAWEYYFDFGGGAPPWTSGLSQATAVQALTRASQRLAEPAYLDLARRALAVFEAPPPDGVRVDGAAGPHYLIYSFAPALRVINAFLQAVIGLHDMAELSGDPRARSLYEAGDAEARLEVPRFDTGAWSLYSLERESGLSYHRLVTTFLRRLCDRTGAPVYCETAARFDGYLDVAPVVTPLTRRVRAGRVAEIRFSLSKISRVGMSVRGEDGTAFATSATVGYGERSFRWSMPREAGTFDLLLTATDLAGNRSQATGTLRVLPARRSSSRR